MGEVRADTAQYSFKVAGKTFQVLSLSAFEEVSQLHRFSLTLWIDDPEVAIEPLVRQDATISISWGGKKKEYHGVVTSFSQQRAGKPGLGGVDAEWGEYTAEVEPTLALLGLTRHCRVFQNMTTDAIIRKVLDGSTMAGKYEMKARACPEREYCVQYRETDLAFVSRLMEEEGIFYYFIHDGQEKMVMGDAAGHYGDCVPDAEVEYKTATGGLSPSDEYLAELTYEEATFTGKVKYKDFNYREPKKTLKVEETGSKNADLEIYDYHLERYRDEGRGRAMARTRVEALEARRQAIVARGTWRSASCGCKVTVSKAYRGDLNGQWAIVGTSLSATQDAEGGVDYTVGFRAVKADVVFRPLQVTPQPSLNPQTATVVGPPGETIYMDKNGRAKVQFHWDLEGKLDENSSCWVRVAQPFAGMDEETQKKHGFQWHPQIGDEVVVDFLEGDPDAPIIVGSVYNHEKVQLIKPEELIRQMILTRYQHQLLMDDKNATITMSTGGGESLTMTDKKREEGRVRLSTCGGESILMEDEEATGGNTVYVTNAAGHCLQLTDAADRDMALLQTRDKHHIVLSDTDHGIQIRTELGHTIKMDDPKTSVLVETAGQHKIEMNDLQQSIVIKSKIGGRIEINDAGMFIEMSSPTGKQKLRVDYAGTGLKLEATSGNIDLLAPSGNVNISAKKVKVHSSGSYILMTGGSATEIVGGSRTMVTTNSCFERVAGSKMLQVGSTLMEQVSGSKVENVGAALAVSAQTILFRASAACTTTAALITSMASGVNTLRGSLVLIN